MSEKITDETIDNLINAVDSGDFEIVDDSAFNEDTTDNTSEDNISIDENNEEPNIDNSDGYDEDNFADIEFENQDTEDTNLSIEEAEETETNDENDDSNQETDSDANEDEEETTQDSNDSDEKEEETNDIGSTIKLSDDTEISIEDAVKYAEFYKKLEGSEFKANNKKRKTIMDPDAIIKSQQMAMGFAQKMKDIKGFKRYQKTLEENGLLDEDKLNMAIDIMNGNKEAIKKHIQDLEFDPIMDLDLNDGVDYQSQNHIKNLDEIERQEIMSNIASTLESSGRLDEYKNIVSDLDSQSKKIMNEDPAIANDLASHMVDDPFGDGVSTYDIVSNRMDEMMLMDTSGRFEQLSYVDKYRTALEAENKIRQAKAKKVETQQEPKKKESTTRSAKKIIDDTKKAEYAKKAEANKKKIAEEKKKATELSSNKRNVQSKDYTLKSAKELTDEEIESMYKAMGL